MTERNAHLQLGIDASSALASAKRLEEALARLATKADRTQSALGKLGAKPIQVRVSSDGVERIQRSIKALAQQIAGIKPIRLQGVSNLGKLKAELTALSAQIARINSMKVGPASKQSAAAPVSTATAAPQEALDRLTAKVRAVQHALDRLASTRVTIQASASALDKAIRAVRALRSEISQVQSVDVTARSDFARLRADLTALSRQISAINSMKVAPVQGAPRAERGASASTVGVGGINASSTALDRLEAKAQATQAALDRLDSKPIVIQVHSTQLDRAARSVTILQRQMGQFRPVDLNFSGASEISRLRAQLSALQRQIASINSTTIKPPVASVAHTATPSALSGGAALAGGAAAVGGAGMMGGAAMAGVAGVAVSAGLAAKEIITVRAKFQDLETQLRTMTGSTEAAAEAQAYLASTSQRLSVDFFDLSASYGKFLPLIKDGSLTVDQARAMLEGLANTQKATGASTEDLKNSMFGLSQTLGMPIANLEQLNQVTEPLPGLLGLMDKAVGQLYPSARKGAGAMRELTEAGKVSSAAFRDIMIKALEEYAGAAEKTSGNISATFTRMKNAWNSLLNTLGEKIEPMLMPVLDAITAGIGGLERGILGLLRGIDGIGNGVQRLHATFTALDWGDPLGSMSKAWSKAKADNPPMAVVPQIGAKTDATPGAVTPTGTNPPAKPAAGTGKPAPLLEGSGGKSKGEQFREEKSEVKNQIALLDQMVSAYDRGREGVEEFGNAEKLLGDQQRYAGQYTKKQTAELMELSKAALELEQTLQLREAIGSMQEAIAATEGLAEAQAMGAEAVRHVEAANTAYNAALSVGMVGNEAARAKFLELAKAAQAAESALALSQRLAQMDMDLTSMDDLVKAHDQGTQAIEDTIVASEAFAAAVQDGVSGNKEDVDAIRSRIAALRELQSVLDQQADVRTMETDLSGISAQSDALRLSGDAYIRRSAEIEKSIELEKAGMDATTALGQSQVRLAGDLAVASNQLSRQNDSLRDLANSGLTFNESMRQISYGGLMSMEDALVDIITGTKSVKEAFADMAKAIAADLARMAVRQAITIPLAMMMGGGMGMPMMGMGMHSGGIVGKERTFSRAMPANAFVGAPRYHSGKMPGIGGGEVPTILKRDEGVFTPAQMASLGPAGGGGAGVVMTNNINVTQPKGATDAEGQTFGKAIVRQMQGMVDERIGRAYKPGGIRNQSGL